MGSGLVDLIFSCLFDFKTVLAQMCKHGSAIIVLL